MSGKITGFEQRPVQVAGRGAPERAKDQPSDASAAAGPTASHVKLTDSAVQLATLERALAQVPDVDLERVQRLRAEIASGDYKVDAQRIASKLMQLERALATADKTPAVDVPGKQV